MNRATALSIFQAGIDAVVPSAFIPGFIGRNQEAFRVGEHWHPRKQFRRLVVLSMGKAAAAMALEVQKLLGDWVDDALVVTKEAHSLSELNWPQLETGHPVPNQASFEAGSAVKKLVRDLTHRDFLLVLLSGGASALVADTPEGCSIADMQEFYQQLLASGANIAEMNAVRKHFSELKGGQLARLASGAKIEVGVLSDVPGDELSVIASGPFYPDNSTIAEVEQILYRFLLTEKMPETLLSFFEKMKTKPAMETPKAGDPLFDTVQHHLLATNQLALKACADEAIRNGFEPIIFQSSLEGEAREAGLRLLESCINDMEQQRDQENNSVFCFLAGGETTVTLTGKGKGGRNQELVLAILAECLASGSLSKRLEAFDFVLLGGGTDGTDGPTDAAGAVIDQALLADLRAQGIDPTPWLTNQDAYTFFKSYGGLVQTGPTQTNVMDLLIILLRHKAVKP